MLDTLVSFVKGRLDGWANTLTGVGGARGRTAFEFSPEMILPDVLLEQLFAGDPFAGRICSALPRHALRKGARIALGDPALDTAIAAEFVRLGVLRKYVEAWIWARTFGGSCIWLGVDDGLDPAEPLVPSRIKSVLFLEVLSKRELAQDRTYSDWKAPNYGETSVFRLQRPGGIGGAEVQSRVHASRMIRFDGSLTTRQLRQQNQGWSHSELQRTLQALRRFNGAWASADELMQDASQGVLKIKNLAAMMASDKQDFVKTRFEVMDLMRSVARAIIVDAEGEDFTRVQTNFTGIPQTLDSFVLYLAGASETPVTVLMGMAPAGLNATGDSDVRNWYDTIESERANEVAPRLHHLARLLCRASDGPTNGRVPPSITVTFPSLWQQTPKERADTRLVVAQTDAVYIAAQVVTPEEVQRSRWRPEGYSDEMSFDADDLDARDAATAADLAAARSTAALPAPAARARLPTPTAGGDAPGTTARGLPAPHAHVDAADDVATGVVVVVQLPTDAAIALGSQLTFEGATRPGDLHITLAYLGYAAAYPADALATLEAVVRVWAAGVPPLDATLGGIGRFPGMGAAPDPVYVPVDAPGLDDARASLVAMLEAAGFAQSEAHGFNAHVTLAYVPADQALPIPRVAPMVARLARAGLWIGPLRIDAPFGGAP